MAPGILMRKRNHPSFLARDYAKCVVAKGKCRLEDPPEKYKPLFNAVEFRSHGFRTMLHSWMTHRVMHPVSTAEYGAFLMFHAPDSGAVNLCEQFALDPALTREIALELGVAHPAIQGQDTIVSTDLVVTFARSGGRLERHAYAIKRTQDLTDRVLQKLAIEQDYWAKRGIGWSLLLDTLLPRELIANMELMMEFVDEDRLPCDRHITRAVTAWLIPHLNTGAPLRIVCTRCDTALDLPSGTTLAVA